ncbi:hypothetical protein AAZX31_08G203700 [Glycine max]|uniref:uncharacterized protein isoform X2 n=1 Tax=Glycine max TaxID=3847 RepID=UPI0003DE8DA5|nr:uncharacterized protein LOC100815479 isoform X2 [Glycine max]XP_028245527.1 uncharacterized protein LOC114423104 isoform X2 [Glycine soja]|eukprot:XP_006585593.1 uncharacterized protein LOC100815479 isoform X2 [Glycine max]
MVKAFSSNCVVLRRFCCLKWTVFVVVSLAGVLVLWPWEPELKIERMNVKRVKVHPIPPVSADVWISLSVRVQNRCMYWMELTDVDVGVKYRGKKMGHVESEGWHVRGWASTKVDGVLEFSGLPSSEVAHLLQDLAMGKIYFHTVIKVYGQLGFLLFRIPHFLQTILACEILVNTKNHSIILQHCLHKD